jgi:hypothetical protein
MYKDDRDFLFPSIRLNGTAAVSRHGPEQDHSSGTQNGWDCGQDDWLAQLPALTSNQSTFNGRGC